MKLRKLSSVVLLTALVAGVAAPTAASAAESTGKVTVEKGTAKPTDPIVDPEIPGNPIDPTHPEIEEGDEGDLAITNTTTLNFGTISTGNAQIKKDAAALALVDKDGKATGEKRGALVAWSDLRGTNAGYTIKAAMTKQFTLGEGDNAKKLGGATISYSNPLLETTAINKEIAPALTSDATAFTLGEDGNAVTIVDAATGKGAGTYVLEFGQSADYDATSAVLGNSAIQAGVDTSDSSVTLTVPAATAASMTLGNYTSTVTWSIEAAPTVEGE